MNHDQTWRPSAADIRFYRKYGWFVSPVIIPEKTLQAAERAITRYYKGYRDNTIPDWATRFDWKPSDGNVLRLNNYVSLQLLAVKELVASPLLGQTAGLLSGTRAVRLYKDSVIMKPPVRGAANTKVGWHTDKSYWMMCSSDTMLTAWIPFQDSNESNGSLAVIEGSHKWTLPSDLRTFNNQDSDFLKQRLQLDPSRFVPKVLNVRRGQVSFHDCRLLHGSMENRTDKPRTVLAVHLQPHENKYREYPDAEGKPLSHLNDFICKKNKDGFPDYTDVTVFPELWRKRKAQIMAS